MSRLIRHVRPDSIHAFHYAGKVIKVARVILDDAKNQATPGPLPVHRGSSTKERDFTNKCNDLDTDQTVGVSQNLQATNTHTNTHKNWVTLMAHTGFSQIHASFLYSDAVSTAHIPRPYLNPHTRKTAASLFGAIILLAPFAI